MNLWVSYHERLESKDRRKNWSKFVDELNAKYNHNRNGGKCKRKIKYLVDRYKERKDWNRKQSGGSIWKSLSITRDVFQVLKLHSPITKYNRVHMIFYTYRIVSYCIVLEPKEKRYAAAAEKQMR